jgi:glycosyltransferase involved in cell wall biosynthesis
VAAPAATSRPAPGAFPGTCLILIPALNEAGVVGPTIQTWLALGVLGVRVIDNGSVDATAQEARAAGAEVVSQPQRGYGAAAWRGLQALPPGTGWVLFSSADGSDALDPAELAAFQAAAQGGADLLLGNRCSHPDSLRALALPQRVCSTLFQYVVQWGWGRTFQDVGSLRAIRPAALASLDLQDRGFGWNVEMQIRAIECGLQVVELPVRFRPRRGGESKISGNLRGTVRAAQGILAILFRLWWTRADRRKVTRGP